MTEPTPPPVITAPTKAWIGAILSTVALVLAAVAQYLSDPWKAVAYSVAGVLGVIGVPFGIYITPNKKVTL